jgi:hypothetical protein
MDIVKLVSAESVLTAELSELFDQAVRELPDYIDGEDEAYAWVGRRILELGERSRRMKQTVQALLASWVVNGEKGQIWMAHPDRPATFREFLEGVGTGDLNQGEDNRLSPSVISDMVAIAEDIVPFCQWHAIGVAGFITSGLWTKFREAIPQLRKASKEEDIARVKELLELVRSLPNRDAVRAELRESRGDKTCMADALAANGKTVIVITCAHSEVATIKRAVSRYAMWQTIAAQQGAIENHTIALKVSLLDD